MRKGFGGAILLLVGITSSVVVKEFRKDRSLDGNHTFYNFNLFDSTVSMEAPFKVKEEALDTPEPKNIVKESIASYQSSNYNFLAACVKLVKGVRGNPNKAVDLMLASLANSRNAQIKIYSKDSSISSEEKYSSYTGELITSEVVSKQRVKDFKFRILTIFKDPYGYVFYLEQNLDSPLAEGAVEKVMASIKLNR